MANTNATRFDPVCGMAVRIEGARYTAEHGGQTYYFCGPGCRKAFESDPGRFLAPNYRPTM